MVSGEVYFVGGLAPGETMKSKFGYTGIRVKDLDASIKFYTTVLGMTARSRETFDETNGVVVDLLSEDGGHPLELNYYEKGSRFDTKYEAGEGLDHLCFRVKDLDQAIAEAQQAGFPVVQEIKTATNRWVYLQDPNGIWIELSAG
jgi:catechol 2,3-dioxygenase-like lactoylglutathione lyase family enzyme